jgi:hypothetical protein
MGSHEPSREPIRPYEDLQVSISHVLKITLILSGTGAIYSEKMHLSH